MGTVSFTNWLLVAKPQLISGNTRSPPCVPVFHHSYSLLFLPVRFLKPAPSGWLQPGAIFGIRAVPQLRVDCEDASEVGALFLGGSGRLESKSGTSGSWGQDLDPSGPEGLLRTGTWGVQ